MATPAPSEASWSAKRYFGLLDEGVLGPDDRVELLEGVIVAMAPHTPEHASGITRAAKVLTPIVAARATIRVQLSFVANDRSVPEPDIAVVPGAVADYDHRHPTTALLVVEVADSSLLQDRMTKAPIYAAAAVSEYWIVNLRDYCVEIFRAPDPGRRQWGETRTARRGERLAPTAFPDAAVAIDDLAARAESATRGFSLAPRNGRFKPMKKIGRGTPRAVRGLVAAGRGARATNGGRRTATVVRRTNETSIEVTLTVDGKGRYDVQTGVPFLNHMLELFTRHGFFDLTIRATGDVEVDDHHTVEDVGLTLGQAFRDALGAKAGIRRFGSATVPLDEALANVVVDLSGRPFLAYDLKTRQTRVGSFDIELIHDFLLAFVNQLGMNLHVRMLAGRNPHHIIEASFKALARALDEATQRDPRVVGVLSTKGTL